MDGFEDAATRPAGAAGYREAAPELVAQYESVGFEQVHRAVLHLLPERPVRVLDVGAGTGRDAAALAARGHRVVAVEPTVELRVHHDGFDWVTDTLPELAKVTGEFELVLLAAVWMHLDGGERARAMRRLAGLLVPGGRLLLMIRQGPVPPGRRMFQVSADETSALAGEFGLAEVHRAERPDGHGRPGVSWTHLALEVPEVL